MTDLEIIKLCAQAMDISLDAKMFINAGGLSWKYEPLYNDAQSHALDAVILQDDHGFWMTKSDFVRYKLPSGLNMFEFHADMTKAENRRRARCECVAKMMQAKMPA